MLSCVFDFWFGRLLDGLGWPLPAPLFGGGCLGEVFLELARLAMVPEDPAEELDELLFQRGCGEESW